MQKLAVILFEVLYMERFYIKKVLKNMIKHPAFIKKRFVSLIDDLKAKGPIHTA